MANRLLARFDMLSVHPGYVYMVADGLAGSILTPLLVGLQLHEHRTLELSAPSGRERQT